MKTFYRGSYDVHKLIIKSKSASTLCKIKISAYHPYTNSAVRIYGNYTTITCVVDNDAKVTCPKCIKRM